MYDKIHYNKNNNNNIKKFLKWPNYKNGEQISDD